MYFAGTAVLLDVACTLCKGTIRDPDEITHKISSYEDDKQRAIPDIVRLPLKLTFPSLSVKPYDTSLVHSTPIQLDGPSGDDVCVHLSSSLFFQPLSRL